MTKSGWGMMAICVTSLLVSARAQAQGEPAAFGSGHQVVLSSERLFGFVHSSQTETLGAMTTTTTINTFSLFNNPIAFTTLYSTPRLALDVFVTDRVSVGGSVSYFTISESESANMGGAGLATSPSIDGFILAPRVGYALALGSLASLWPRLGFTYVHLSNSNAGTSQDVSVYAITLEAPFVFNVAPHFFVSVAPTFDLGLGGSSSNSGGGVGIMNPTPKETDFGILCALGGFF